MARRMYDLDNGTENIKVKTIAADNITAVTSAIGSLTIGLFVRIPPWSTAGRPTLTGQQGTVIYDNDLGKLILWNGTAWVNVDGTALS